ncbi:MAG: glycosyltransferase, partial [Flavobacteriales bacterium]
MNWGIGHATRSSVLVDELIQQGAKLTIASSGAAKAWLEQHYPQLQIKDKPGIDINYPSKNSIQWALVKQTPALLKLSTDEASWTEEMLNEHQFNAIISDNCYGCYHPKVVSILITHQLNLPLPQPMKMAAQNILNKQLKNFNEIWVPDHSKKPNFSGELSQTTDSRVNFIGPLSRFKPSAQVKNPQGWLGLVSGPEPRRTEFENELYHLLSRWPGKHHLFTGTIKPLNQSTDNLTVHSMNDSGSIAQLLSQSEGVICRSGYSSLMDIAQFNIPLILVPTKGQAEQEYL